MPTRLLHGCRGWGVIFFPLFLFSLLFASCTELRYVKVEQMLPPEIMPEWGTRSVGIVNNFSRNNVVVVNEEASIYACDPDSMIEEIALSFADAGVMDRVVVLDSVIYPADGVSSHKLSQQEVNALCEYLDVSLLYSLEYACLAVNWGTPSIGRPMNAYLCSRYYTPDTDTLSGTAILDKKVVESWAYDTAQARQLMPEVPYLLAQQAIVPYLPAWKERERVYYYNRLCYELREARVYVAEDNWEAAAQQWRVLAQSKQRIHRFIAAYNMALYYEMTDSIDQAIASLDLAKEFTIRYPKKGGGPIQVIDPDYVNHYREALIERRREIERINAFWQR